MIHQFEHKGEYIVLDIASGAVHTMDSLSYTLCSKITAPPEKNCPQEIVTELAYTFPRSEIEEAYGELYELYQEGLLFSVDEPLPIDLINPQNTPIKALCLHVSHDCNLRCQYCFAQTGDFGTVRSLMDSEIAQKAIDFVIENSGTRHNIEIDFFGGEPLMAWETVKKTVDYANEQGKLHNKNFRFTITTNGLLLNDDIIEYINNKMCNVVLSLDGRKNINDWMRPTISGTGSYEIIMPKFKKLAKSRGTDKDYYIRGTYTGRNLDFCQDVFDIYDNGFNQISLEPVIAQKDSGYELKESDLPGLREEYWHLAEKILELEEKGEYLNFFHFNVDLEQGPCVIKRLRGCGAGCEYVAITPEGDIYPCHQFVGYSDYKMGNISDGSFDKSKAEMFSKVNIYSKEECRDCWARFYCSGGCSAANFQANHDINKSYLIGCELEKMRLECAIYLAVKRA
ncbi:MAG: thioether cross-link-forming SCIFF peptide maturase [Bacillota bacterium]|jgi:uncharacterized protein